VSEGPETHTESDSCKALTTTSVLPTPAIPLIIRAFFNILAFILFCLANSSRTVFINSLLFL